MGLSYSAFTSTDLKNWSAQTDPTSIVEPIDAEWERVVFDRLVLPGAGQLFLQFTVTIQE